jgi:hypothetical protein
LNTENLTISAIIPASEEGKTICEAIKQIKRSNAFQTQIIVVDGTGEITKEEKVEMTKDTRVRVLNHSAFLYLDDTDN